MKHYLPLFIYFQNKREGVGISAQQGTLCESTIYFFQRRKRGLKPEYNQILASIKSSQTIENNQKSTKIKGKFLSINSQKLS